MKFSTMIEDALDAEQKALSLIAEARTEGVQKDKEADKEAADLIKKAKEEAQETVNELIGRTEAEIALAEKAGKEALAVAEEAFFKGDEALVNAAADAAFSLLTTPRYSTVKK